MKKPLFTHAHELLDLGFDPPTGALVQVRFHQIELVALETEPRPLFVMRFRDRAGVPLTLSSLELGPPQFVAEQERLTIVFDAWEKFRVKAVVSVVLIPGAAESHWGIALEHGREGYLEWIELPRLVVPNNLRATGGDATVFWPAIEGVLVDDLERRESGDYAYREVEYPNSGWCGYYPGIVPQQFLAYSTGGATLYYASHDPDSHTKEIEYCRDRDGIRLIQKVYPGAIAGGHYRLPYPVVIGARTGDWYAAASCYREWITSGSATLPRPLRERTDLPAWISQSPIVVAYPVTGAGHHSGPTVPNEYFPFTQALPALDQLAAGLESPLLVMPLHWEGTAPWAPPYVWPPLGGETGLREFVAALHRRGHRIGLYCSGIAWTNEAETGTGQYSRRDEFDRHGLIREMCRGPRGEYGCVICQGGGLRHGYDMCVATEFARDTITEETVKIAKAGVDYIQLLDQNLGGASYQCYDSAHGHPSAPGPWQARAVNELLIFIRRKLVSAGKGDVVLGCEAAAAEPYLSGLPVNDLRFHMAFAYGLPVPAYAYVFHEYTANFMGNQVMVADLLEHAECPETLWYRFAYGFSAGDLLRIILKDHGQLHWGWCAKWEVDPPDQAKAVGFVAHLNRWRRGVGRDFLFGGRMLSPVPLEHVDRIGLPLRKGPAAMVPAVMWSQWSLPSGAVAGFAVNFTEKTQLVRLGACAADRVLLRQPESLSGSPIPGDGGEVSIEPLTAVMISYGR